MPETTTEFAPQWAIVEIMGHQRYTGLVSEQTVFGTVMCRVDVPEVAAWTDRYNDEHPAQAAYSKLFGGSSIYAITPVTEEVARAACKRNSPALNVYIPELNAMPAPQIAQFAQEYDNTDDGERPEDVFADS